MSRSASLFVPVPACLLGLLAALVFSQATAHGEDRPGTQTDERKDHAVFVGATILVDSPKGNGELIEVVRRSARIATTAGPTTVPIRQLTGAQTRRTPKMSGTILAIADLRGERTFTRASDPARMALDEMADMSHLRSEKIDTAMANAMAAERQVAYSDMDRDALSQIKAEVQSGLESAFVETSGNMFNSGSTMGRAENRATDETSDAYEVAFTVTAPAPVENVHAVLILMVKSPGPSREAVSHLNFKQLPDLDPEPRRMRLRCEGLPLGYSVESFAVHIYANGRELATSQSDKAVVVTRHEAFQFLMIRYLLEHKSVEAPPRIASEFIPVGVRSRLSSDMLSRSAEVRVSADGTVLDVKLDGTGTQEVDAYLDSVLRECFFFPALRQGVPTETETTVVLSELVH